MARIRQRVLVPVLGAVFLIGVGGFASVAPASAQTPGGATAAPLNFAPSTPSQTPGGTTTGPTTTVSPGSPGVSPSSTTTIPGFSGTTTATGAIVSPAATSASPLVGYPFGFTSPFTGLYPFLPSSLLGTSNIPFGVYPYSYTSYVPLSAYMSQFLVPQVGIGYPYPLLPEQESGIYCVDKTNGQVWQPTGAPPDPLLVCGAGGTPMSGPMPSTGP